MKTTTTSDDQESGSYLGSLWMVVGAICFTIMGVLVKHTSIQFGLHAYELVFWRVVFSTVMIGGQAWLFKQTLATKHGKAHFWRSLIGTFSLFTFFYGIHHLPLATAITFSNTSTIFLAIWSVILLRQFPNRLTWFALILGLIGVILILRPSIIHHGTLPTMIGLASGVMAGYAYLQVRELSLAGEPSWRIVFYFSALASVLSGMVSTVKGWTALSIDLLPYLFGIGAFGMAGQLAMTYAYKVGRKFMVAALSYLVVVLSTLYGVMVFDEISPMMAIIGIGLVILSGILAGKK